jgi:hypothetical protein
MRKQLFTFILSIQSIVGFSQFTDDFSDGDFTNNPVWSGGIGSFEVDAAFQLHLNDTVANVSYLATESNAIENGSWEFDVQMDFSPSTSNFSKIYLVADEQNLSNNLNGYFVKIGGQSGTSDDVSLYVQNGTDGLSANSPNLKVKVTRDAVGNWELFLDTAGVYFSEGNAFDDTFLDANYFGVYCKYTITRADKFWFDNFIVSGDSASIVRPQNVNQNDILINELFTDPSPSIGLPAYEFIELYNCTDSAIDLTDWSIIIGTTQKQFPLSVIEADSFVILVKDEAIDSFPSNIAKIGFSSISLTNAGADVVLKDSNGKTINAISYTDKWYHDENKNEGGWSIERVSPNLFCEGKNNWRASIASVGGTPGKQNSVFGEAVFIEDFNITRAYIIDSNKVYVQFNKSLDALLFSDSSIFEVNGISAIKSVPSAPFFNATTLSFNFNFLENTTYTIAANGLLDCAGNTISNTVNFAIPDSAIEGEIVINEVLFNPRDDGVDYLELYNNSNSFFDLSKLKLANFFMLGTQINPIGIKPIAKSPVLFAPNSYLVLTADSAKVKAQYYCENSRHFIEVESMPTLSNEEGSICLVHQSLNQIIDAFSYHADMHFALLNDVDGVSLERLYVENETQKSDNWHSAASTVGYGTPTYENSQQFISQIGGEVIISPQSFSPNNDGNKDVASINWNFKQAGLMATIKIFDSEGRWVRTLLNNKLISNKGNIIWDGASEDGLKLATGIYIVWLEVFSENGNVDQYKEVVVLSR